MKIRNGFVSNSSSSSFIVAFPEKPKSFDDVYEMLFNSKEGGIQPYDWIDGMSHTQVAMRVWEDIKKGSDGDYCGYLNLVPAKVADIQKEMSNRYYYHSADGCVSVWGAKTDELGGQWSPPLGKYCGEDKDAVNEFREFTIKTESRERAIRLRQTEIFHEEFKIERAPYACKGGKDSSGKPYTQKAIKAYSEYSKALEKFKKEHKEYSKLEKELRGGWDEKYATEERLRKKIAKADTASFRNDNKGSFFVILSYADDGGECVLEHGDIFKNVPSVRVSHH